MTRPFPYTHVIPPDRAALPGLALPDGLWTRLPDGGIRVVFRSAEQLLDSLNLTLLLQGRRDEKPEAFEDWPVKSP